MEGGQKGGLKSGANFPCCIKMTFQRVVGGKGSIGAFSRRFLRVFGVSGEAVPRKGVNLLKTTPKQQKTSAKPLSSSVGVLWSPGRLLRGCIALPRLLARGTFPLLQPGHQPFARLENLPFGKAFSQRSNSAVLATRG